MSLFIAIAVVAVGWWLIKTMAKTSPDMMRGMKPKIMGYGALAAAFFLATRNHFETALALGAMGLGLLGKSHWFPNSPGQKPSSGEQASHSRTPQRPGVKKMERGEALKILGLKEGASADDIRDAHRRLIKSLHPDIGGSDYLASQINDAKAALLAD
jgi:hypothetical protein